MQDIVLYCFYRLPKVCVNYYAELDGYHHARFLRDFLKKSHEARQRNLRDYFGVFSVTLIFPRQILIADCSCGARVFDRWLSLISGHASNCKVTNMLRF